MEEYHKGDSILILRRTIKRILDDLGIALEVGKTFRVRNIVLGPNMVTWKIVHIDDIDVILECQRQ